MRCLTKRRLPLLSFTHSCKHTTEHTHPHTHSILKVRMNSSWDPCPLTTHVHSVSLLLSTLFFPLLLSGLDVVKRVKIARLRRSTSHAEPSIQRVLGGPVQRVVLRERQHHCISLQEKRGDFNKSKLHISHF